MAYQTEVELTLKVKFTLVGNQKTLSQNQFDKMSRLSKRKIYITSYNLDSIVPKKIDYKGEESLKFTVLHRKIIEKHIDKNYRFYKHTAYPYFIAFEICPAGYRSVRTAFVMVQGKDLTIYRNNPPAVLPHQIMNVSVHNYLKLESYKPITVDLSEPTAEEQLTKALSGPSLRMEI